MKPALDMLWRMLRQLRTTISVRTKGRRLHEITGDVQGWVAESGFDDGLLTMFVRHTSASLLIQENADPDVHGDLDRFFARLVPDGDALFRHQDEGPEDMPAHVRGADCHAAVHSAAEQAAGAGCLAGHLSVGA